MTNLRESSSDDELEGEQTTSDGEQLAYGKEFFALLFIGFGLTLTSLFVPYGSGTANKSLASDPSVVLLNTPLLLVLAVASVLSWIDRTRQSAIILALLAATWLIASDASDLLGAVVHQATLGIGAQLSAIGAGVVFVAVAIGWRETPLHVRIRRDALSWSGLSCVLAIIWIIGESMDWTSTHYHVAAARYTFPATHTTNLVVNCCVAFRGQTMPANVREALTDALLLFAGIAVAFLIPNRTAAIALLGVGVIYLANSLSWLYPIAQSNVDPVTSGVSAAAVRRAQETAFVTPLPGGWIALAAACCLVFLGIYRLLTTFADPPVPTAP